MISISFDEEMRHGNVTRKVTDGVRFGPGIFPLGGLVYEQFFAVRIEGPGTLHLSGGWKPVDAG